MLYQQPIEILVLMAAADGQHRLILNHINWTMTSLN